MATKRIGLVILNASEYDNATDTDSASDSSGDQTEATSSCSEHTDTSGGYLFQSELPVVHIQKNIYVTYAYGKR